MPTPPTEEGAPEYACASIHPSVQSRHPCLSKALTKTPAPGWPCADPKQDDHAPPRHCLPQMHLEPKSKLSSQPPRPPSASHPA